MREMLYLQASFIRTNTPASLWLHDVTVGRLLGLGSLVVARITFLLDLIRHLMTFKIGNIIREP